MNDLKILNNQIDRSVVTETELEEYAAGVQSDWEQTDSTKPDYIKNKPDVGFIEVNCRLDSAGSKFLHLAAGETVTVPELIQAWKAGKTIRCKFDADGYSGLSMYVVMTCYNEGRDVDGIDESLSGYGGCFDDSQSEGIVLGQYFLPNISE